MCGFLLFLFFDYFVVCFAFLFFVAFCRVCVVSVFSFVGCFWCVFDVCLFVFVVVRVVFVFFRVFVISLFRDFVICVSFLRCDLFLIFLFFTCVCFGFVFCVVCFSNFCVFVSSLLRFVHAGEVRRLGARARWGGPGLLQAYLFDMPRPIRDRDATAHAGDRRRRYPPQSPLMCEWEKTTARHTRRRAQEERGGRGEGGVG